MFRWLSRLRAIVGLTVAQLRHYRARTVLAVFGILLAVLSMTLLASVGVGVFETGQQKFQASGQELWVTGGPVRFAPGQVGGIENTLVDAHNLSNELARRDGVKIAAPMAFQTVYVGATKSDLHTVVGVGVPNVGSSKISIQKGSSFQKGDIHYAGGSYDGPMTHEVIIDSRTADLLNVSVGDTVYIGGTIASARQNNFTVVGIGSRFSTFVGASIVTLHLSELQEITGSKDRATFITVSLEQGADPDQVQRELQRAYPEYDVRTNQQQLQATLENQVVIIASAVTLVVLAVLAGVTLTVNLLALVVHQQRTELAALKAIGVSSRTLIGVIAGQGLLFSLLGGALGLLLTVPAAAGLNQVAVMVVGFENLVRTPRFVFVGGAVIAVVIGVISAAVAGWRVTRVAPLDHFEK